MNAISRRTFGFGVAAASLAGSFGANAQQAYPASIGTVKIVVPFPPGGTTDIVGRVLADRLSALWKVGVIVENVPGAAGNIGMSRIAKGPQDGSQILILPAVIAIVPYLYNNLNYDPEKDLLPLTQVISLPNLLCVRKDLPVSSVAELIAYATANPGKLNYASPGIGTTIHLSGELFKAMTGTEMVHVAYRGSAPALNDLVAQNVDLMFDNIPAVINHAREGTVKPLGVTTMKRSSIAPEYPAIAETVPDFDTSSWFGVAVRAGTPDEIADIIEKAVRDICQEPVVRDRFASVIAEAVGSSRTEFATYIATERTKWSQLISTAKIKSP